MYNAIIFDLDDTLYKEIDYVMSGFKAVSTFVAGKTNQNHNLLLKNLILNYNADLNPFLSLIDKYSLDITIKEMKNIYRSHIPTIQMDMNTKNILTILKRRNELRGLMTDGRTIQQRNKIKSLGLEQYFSDILISGEFGSEKPNIANYSYFMKNENNLNTKYFYIGDNPKKDFKSANELGWITICLRDNGRNIHNQSFLLKKEYLPMHIIDSIEDLLAIIDEE
tara:strand:+ start:1401 stop:2069 length:669 start_codon:yes stop_codon:yes gene_type:complete